MSLGFEKSKILVVGGAGFVGSNLCHLLLTDTNVEELWIVDNLLSSDMCNVSEDPRIRFLYGSITDACILALLPRDIQYVFHLACYHGNQSSIADPFADHENNTLTTLKLFDALKDFPSLRKVIYAAAGCAVAEKTFNEAKPTTEDAPVSLYHDSPYSISKLIGEMYGNYYFQHYGLPFVKARFQNVYGPREMLGAGHWRGTPHTVWRNVVPTFVWKSLHGEALPLDNGGNASRDFIFVEDMARGLVACALRGEPGEVYNLASGVETTIGELARLINEYTKNKTPVEMLPARDWDRSGKRFGSTGKAREKLGFEANVAVAEGLERTVKWTVSQRENILRTMKTHSYFVPEVMRYSKMANSWS